MLFDETDQDAEDEKITYAARPKSSSQMESKTLGTSMVAALSVPMAIFVIVPTSTDACGGTNLSISAPVGSTRRLFGLRAAEMLTMLSEHFGIFASVHNLADERYADSASLGSGATPVYSPGLPRTLYAGVEGHW